VGRAGVTSTLAWSADEAALREAVAAFCAGAGAGARRFDRARWRALAELGVLAIGASEGGARELVAVCEALGEAAFSGPIVETVIAVQLTAGAERAALVAGEKIASVGAPPRLPFGCDAALFFVLAGERVHRAEPRGAVEPVETLAGDAWGRVDLAIGGACGESERALGFGRLASAGLLLGAAGQLLEAAAAHARTRKQFGKSIGEFQAVAHPLAEGWIRQASASFLARAAATARDREEPDAHALAGAARLAAREAALAVAHQAHQTFGAVGITQEGPAFAWSSRIRQWASADLGDAHARAAQAAPLLGGAQ
jgi:hypothetical protein